MNSRTQISTVALGILCVVQSNQLRTQREQTRAAEQSRAADTETRDAQVARVKELERSKFQLYYGGFGGSPSGYAELQQLYSKAPLRINVTQFKLAEYDRAMEQFLKSADDEVQIAAARTMSEIARTYMPEMPAIYRLENYFVHGWVRGFAPPIFTSYWKYLDIDLAQRRQAAERPPR